MADGVLAAEAGEHPLVEHLAHEPQVLDDRDLAVIADRDSCALLAAVLQGVETEEGQTCDVMPRRVDAEDAATVVEMVVVHCARSVDGQASRCGSDS